MNKQDQICHRFMNYILKRPINSFITLFVLCLIIAPTFILFLFFSGRELNLIHVDYDAKDILGFWGSFLGFLGTVVLGFITISLSKKANDINLRLMSFEEKRHIYETRPFIRITNWQIERFDLGQEPSFIYHENMVIEIKLDGETKESSYSILLTITNTGNVYTSVHLSEIRFFDNPQRTGSSRPLSYGYTNQNDWNLYLDVKSNNMLVIACSAELIDYIRTYKYLDFIFILENSFGNKFRMIVSALVPTISNNHIVLSNLSYKIEEIDYEDKK